MSDYEDYDPYNWKRVALKDSPFFTERTDGDAAAIIAGAVRHGLETVVVVGVDFTGGIYLASTTTAAEMITLMAEATARLLTGQIDEPLKPERTPCPPVKKRTLT